MIVRVTEYLQTGPLLPGQLPYCTSAKMGVSKQA